MFAVIATIAVEGKATINHQWEKLEKVHVVEHLEKKLNDFMQKMNAMKAPADVTRTNPATLVLTCTVYEDGVLWAKATYEYPNMSEEMQAVFIGAFDGELATLDMKGEKKAKATKADK